MIMKNIQLILVILIATAGIARSQITWGDYSQSYPTGATDKSSTVALILAIPKDNNSFWTVQDDSKYFTAANKDTAFMAARQKDITARTTFDTAKAQLFLHGVNRLNSGEYQFRVMVYPQRIVLPWSPVTRFTTDSVIASSGLPEMAYLGGFKAKLGEMLVIDVRKKGEVRIVATAMIAWEEIFPAVENMYTANELNLFFKRLSRPWSVRNDKRWKDTNPATGLPRNLDLSAGNNGLILLLNADIYHKEQVEYTLMRKNKTIIHWKVNDFDNNFIWLQDLAPGSYQLQIRYAVQREHVKTYKFEVKPAWYQSLLFKIICGLLLSASSGAFIFLMLFIRQKQKTKEELSRKNKVQLELKSIYAQLNPHFVFNALSSIQGLINRQDIRGANEYLSDFSKLMRESLQNSDKEVVPLLQEMRTLEVYLKLEQLRFGFKFSIVAADDINLYETGIPSLLLQPLIENAVKHGVSGLQENGSIAVSFFREEDTLRVSITDNGNGFTGKGELNGFGLKLTEDRIKLLNDLHKEQQIVLYFDDAAATGTTVYINFNNWFL